MLNRWTTPLALRLAERESAAFDRRYGVDTASWVMLDEMTIEDGAVEEARPYVPAPPRVLRALLRRNVPDPHGWTFVDFGSGRARALIIAAAYGFSRVAGIEFGRELHEAAVQNVERVAERLPAARRIEPVLGDATLFDLPRGPLALYFNNPFTGGVFDAVAENIESSYRADPRPIVLLYQTMKVEDPGQGGRANLDRLDRSAELRPVPFHARRPLDALALRPFLLRVYATAEALGAAEPRREDSVAVPA